MAEPKFWCGNYLCNYLATRKFRPKPQLPESLDDLQCDLTRNESVDSLLLVLFRMYPLKAKNNFENIRGVVGKDATKNLHRSQAAKIGRNIQRLHFTQILSEKEDIYIDLKISECRKFPGWINKDNLSFFEAVNAAVELFPPLKKYPDKIMVDVRPGEEKELLDVCRDLGVNEADPDYREYSSHDLLWKYLHDKDVIKEIRVESAKNLLALRNDWLKRCVGPALENDTEISATDSTGSSTASISSTPIPIMSRDAFQNLVNLIKSIRPDKLKLNYAVKYALLEHVNYLGQTKSKASRHQPYDVIAQMLLHNEIPDHEISSFLNSNEAQQRDIAAQWKKEYDRRNSKSSRPTPRTAACDSSRDEDQEETPGEIGDLELSLRRLKFKLMDDSPDSNLFSALAVLLSSSIYPSRLSQERVKKMLISDAATREHTDDGHLKSVPVLFGCNVDVHSLICLDGCTEHKEKCFSRHSYSKTDIEKQDNPTITLFKMSRNKYYPMSVFSTANDTSVALPDIPKTENWDVNGSVHAADTSISEESDYNSPKSNINGTETRVNRYAGSFIDRGDGDEDNNDDDKNDPTFNPDTEEGNEVDDDDDDESDDDLLTDPEENEQVDDEESGDYRLPVQVDDDDDGPVMDFNAQQGQTGISVEVPIENRIPEMQEVVASLDYTPIPTEGTDYQLLKFMMWSLVGDHWSAIFEKENKFITEWNHNIKRDASNDLDIGFLEIGYRNAVTEKLHEYVIKELCPPANNSDNSFGCAIRRTFLNEFEEATKLQEEILRRKGRFMHYQEKQVPSLVQTLVCHRLERKSLPIPEMENGHRFHRLGNWSMAGSGKTLAAILATKCVGAGLHVIFTPSGGGRMLKQWADSIRDGSKGQFLIDLSSMSIKSVILDEMHSLKSVKPKKSKVIQEFIQKAEQHNLKLAILGLSATPVVNYAAEGWQLLKLLGSTYDADRAASSASYSKMLRLHRAFVSQGCVMYKVNYESQLDEKIDKIPLSSDAKVELRQLAGKFKKKIPDIEIQKVLTKARLPDIKEKVEEARKKSKKILIYTELIGKSKEKKGATLEICDMIKKEIEDEISLKKVCVYTGVKSYDDRDQNFSNFLQSDEYDVLIASSAIATGVNGLQNVCDILYINVLPWTRAGYDQLVGRLYRRQQRSERVTVWIPILCDYNGPNSIRDSFCWRNWKRIKNKEDNADVALYGQPKEIRNLESILFERKLRQNEIAVWVLRLAQRYGYLPNDQNPTDWRVIRKSWHCSEDLAAELESQFGIWAQYHASLNTFLEEHRSILKNSSSFIQKCIISDENPQLNIAGVGCAYGQFYKALTDGFETTKYIQSYYNVDYYIVQDVLQESIHQESNNVMVKGRIFQLNGRNMDVVIFFFSLTGMDHRKSIEYAWDILPRGGTMWIVEDLQFLIPDLPLIGSQLRMDEIKPKLEVFCDHIRCLGFKNIHKKEIDEGGDLNFLGDKICLLSADCVLLGFRKLKCDKKAACGSLIPIATLEANGKRPNTEDDSSDEACKRIRHE